MTIGQTFADAKQVIVLVQCHDGTEHAFQVDGGTVRWEWTGQAHGPELGHGSAGKVTAEGRFHRKNRQGDTQPSINPSPRGAIGQ